MVGGACDEDDCDMAVEWSAERDAAAASLSTQSLSHASGAT